VRVAWTSQFIVGRCGDDIACHQPARSVPFMSVWTSQRKKYSPAEIAGTSYGNAVFAVLRSHPAAKLERRMNGDSASRSNSRQGSERRDWLRGKPAK